MLDFIYYPVSGILWVWHKVFGAVLGPESGLGWALSVVMLVFTLRAILYKPFVKQVQSTRQMQEFQPQMAALRKKYAKDRQKMSVELQKLQKEHGFNPLLGCLPALLQIPIFIGLYHVLHSFNRTGGIGPGRMNLTPQQNWELGNYVFSKHDVQSFLQARLFGVPLSSYVTQPAAQWKAFVNPNNLEKIDFTHVNIATVAIPLMIIAGFATHMNARASVKRQAAAAAANPQTAIMNRLSMYVFPLGVLVGGIFLPIAILVYWVSNNGWTYVQQHYVFKKLDKEDELKKSLALEKRSANAPKPGAKPARGKKGAPSIIDGTVEGEVTDVPADDDDSATDSDQPDLTKKPQPGQKPQAGQKTPATQKPQPGRKPQPGQKAASPKRAPSGNRSSSSRSGGTAANRPRSTRKGKR